MAHESSIIYFAYGSNLDLEQMGRRCPGARALGTAILGGFRLGFAGRSSLWGGGVATLVRDIEAFVPGLLWTLAPSDLERLDRFEGHPYAYERTLLQVCDADGNDVRACVYIKEGASPNAPTDDYAGLIRRAYIHRGFDEALLERALRESSSRTAPVGGAR